MPTRMTIAELADHLGAELGCSEWVTVDFDDVVRFADATGDHQWIHVDRERAAAGPYGAPIAHGYLLLTIIAKLFPQILEVANRSMSVNYGTDRVRFLSPVRIGSEIRLSGRLVAADPRPDGGVLTKVATTLELKGSEKPAVVAELLFIMQPRTPLPAT